MGEIVELNTLKEKQEEIKNLKNRFIELVEELEDTKKKFKNVDSNYLLIFGGLLHERLELSIKTKYLKHKLRLILSNINKGKNIDLKEIDKILKIKLENYYKDLNYFDEKIKDLYSESVDDYICLTEREVLEVKKTFRFIAKKLHPDLNKGLTEHEKKLWDSALKAYENNDLITLIGIKLTLENGTETFKDIRGIDTLKLRITKLKEKITKINNTFPLNIKDKLHEREYIQEEKENIISDIDIYKEKIQDLNQEIKKYLEMI